MDDELKDLFETLEVDRGFRVDFLHFLQLTNNALSNIVQDYFSRRRSKTCRSVRGGKIRFRARIRKSRRLYQAICGCSAANNRDKSELCVGIIYFDEDLFKKSNWQIFDCLSDKDKGGLRRSFNEKFFTDYERWEDFHKDWQCLWEKRDYLVHYRDRQSNRRCFGQGQGSHINNENVIVSMSRFLLNYLNEEFVKKVESHLKKQAQPKELVESIKVIVRDVNKSKKETKDRCSGERSKGFVSRRERQRQQCDKEVLIAKRDRYYNDSNSRHRLSKFKNLYYFVGKKNIKDIKRIFGDNRSLQFNDYKAIFDLYTKINMITHRYLEELRSEFFSRGNGQGDDFGKLAEALPEYRNSNRFLLDNLVNIRNAVEHNRAVYCCRKSYGKNKTIQVMPEKTYKESFAREIAAGGFDFDTERYCFFEVVAYMMKAIDFYLGSESLNGFYTHLRGALEGENYCEVMIEPGKWEKVTNWSRENRQKYKDLGIDKRKRKNVRQVAGQWHKDMDEAKKGLKK